MKQLGHKVVWSKPGRTDWWCHHWVQSPPSLMTSIRKRT